jgi:hypothetical protein
LLTTGTSLLCSQKTLTRSGLDLSAFAVENDAYKSSPDRVRSTAGFCLLSLADWLSGLGPL